MPLPGGVMAGDIACGDDHTLVLIEGEGTVYACGSNGRGQLGLGICPPVRPCSPSPLPLFHVEV